MTLPKIAVQHIVDEQAQQIFRQLFNKNTGYLVQKCPDDYGIDYYVYLIDDIGQVGGAYFNVQLKGMGKVQVQKKHISISLKKSTINLFSRQLAPTILVVVDVSTGKSYWHNSFDFTNELDRRHPSWRNDLGKTTTIHLPISHVLSSEEHARIRTYVESVYNRRSAVMQGAFPLMQSSETTIEPLSLSGLADLVKAHDYNRFFDAVSKNPFYYLSDKHVAALFELIEQIPPKKYLDKPNIMAVLAIVCYSKGFYQEARKWGQLSLEGLHNKVLFDHVNLIRIDIDFMYGYISEDVMRESLERMTREVSEDIQNLAALRKIRLEHWQKEKVERAYGRFRQIELVKQTIEHLWHFADSATGGIKELIFLELGHFYSILVPFLWLEIESTAFMREKVGLKLTGSELHDMREEAVKATNEASSVFTLFVEEEKAPMISLRTRAEGLFAFAIYLYHLQMNIHNKLIFIKDLFDGMPESVALTGDENKGIRQALSFCETARNIFRTIGAKDREDMASVFILGFYEDLDEKIKYEATKTDIENSLKVNWIPNTSILFEQTLREGSLRTRLIKYIALSKRTSDYERANTSVIDIDAEVDCNSNTFNITDKSRIDNLRKDIMSSVSAAKYRVSVCRHFELLQDIRHTASLETLYTIDPERVGICRRYNHKSKKPSPDFESVINQFKEAFCNDCRSKEPSTS